MESSSTAPGSPKKSMLSSNGVSGRPRASQMPRRGQHDRQVLQHLHLRVDHGAGVAREGQHVVEAGRAAGRAHGLQGRTDVGRVLDMTGDAETDLVGVEAGVVGVAAFQVGIDVEVVQPAVGVVVGRVIEITVTQHHAVDALVGDRRPACHWHPSCRRVVEGLVIEQRVALHRADQRDWSGPCPGPRGAAARRGSTPGNTS